VEVKEEFKVKILTRFAALKNWMMWTSAGLGQY
jgi:hypothetical protein